jgi:hypothetical protein
VQASGLIRTLQTKDRPTKLARALEELGRMSKTLYLLRFIDDEAYRRRIVAQLNRDGAGSNLPASSSAVNRAACGRATENASRNSSARSASWWTSSCAGTPSIWTRR